MGNQASSPVSFSRRLSSSRSVVDASSSASASVVWLPDDASAECMTCSDAFTFFNRRHHCRACGRVVCARCSSMRAALDGDGDTAVEQRVCDSCHHRLTRRAEWRSYSETVRPSTPPHKRRDEEQKEEKEGDGSSSGSISPSTRLSERRRRCVHFGSTHDIPALAQEEEKEQDSASPSSAAPSPCLSPSSAASCSSSDPRYDDACVYSSPSPLADFSLSATPAPISCVDLFNSLSGFGPLLMLDVRPAADYSASHVPRALSLPVSLDDVRDNSTLEALEARLLVVERRRLRMRQRASIVVIAAEQQQEETESEAERMDGGLTCAAYLCSLLLLQPKHSTLCVLSPGYALFQRLYPFLSCRSDGPSPLPHAHLAAFPAYPSELVPAFLYLGSHSEAANLPHLLQLRVSHVVNLTTDIPQHFPSRFQYTRVALQDLPSAPLLAALPALCAFLSSLPPTARVLLHCHSGISRSVAVALAFLMQSRRWTLSGAWRFLKRRRRQALPNIGFWRQLADWEQQLSQERVAGDGAAAGLQDVDEHGMLLAVVGQGAAPWPGTLHKCVDVEAMEAEYQEMIRRREQQAAGVVDSAELSDREQDSQGGSEAEAEVPSPDEPLTLTDAASEELEDERSEVDSVVRTGDGDAGDDSSELNVRALDVEHW